MKNAQELIDAIKDVPDEFFHQNHYYDHSKRCGCIMHHYEMKKNCAFADADQYQDYFYLNLDEWRYIFASKVLINDTAAKNGWPICEEFTVESAIDRIKFIDSLQ